MKLRDWLDGECLSFREFGERIDRSAEAVRRYALDLRIPDRETMPRIVRETNGCVTANDFFDIDPALSDDDDTDPRELPSTGQTSEMAGQAVAR